MTTQPVSGGSLQLGCSFATSPDTAMHVAIAEQLGYERAWLYDSPALYPDVWMALTECAMRTSSIRIGPAVLVPSLRHPMVNASAIVHLCHLAPGRVQVALGAGLTGQVTLGQRPLRWAHVREYAIAVQRLCRGDTVEWDGAAIRLIHPDGFASCGQVGAADVEWFIGAAGLKGIAVAREIADGVLAKTPVAGMPHSIVNVLGTVLDTGEALDGERVIAAAGHGAAMALHNMVQRGTADVAAFEGGTEWLSSFDAIPAAERHLALYEQHLVGVTDRDRAMLTPAFMERFSGARTTSQWHALFTSLAAEGATGVSYQPAGPDIAGELERFADVFQSWADR